MPQHVDECLLLFVPFYKEMLLRERPEIAAELTDEIASEALLKALIANGDATVSENADGIRRYEATEKYRSVIEGKG